MRNTLLFSLALGLAVTTVEAKTSKVANTSNLAAATAYSSGRLVQNTVTGTVSDANGPVSGITVSVVGASGVVTTDTNGKFRITAALGSTLRFSSVGYFSREIKVTANTVNVVLDFDDKALDEVVVVGFGRQKKEHLTGAVSSVNVEKTLGSRPIPDAARGLQGAVPGLSIRIPTGEVGSDPLVRIRGHVGSIQGSSAPLILVDNVEIPSINMVNPDDIAEITVLKDAASSAIYGAKAAFGVLLITTKKGAKTDSQSITYSNNLSTQTPFKAVDIAGIDGLEYTLAAHENMQQAGAAGGFWRISRESLEKAKEWQQKYGNTVKSTDPMLYGRDWEMIGGEKYGYRLYDPASLMIKDNAFSHLHNIGVNGKAGNTSYNLSAGYLGQQGMMKAANHDDYTRYSGTLNISTKLNDFLTMRGGMMYTDGTKRYANSATGFTADPWLYLYRWSRLFPTGVTENGVELRDPYFDTKNAHTAYKTDRYTNINLGTTVDLMSGWDVQADYAYSTQNNSQRSSMPTFTGKTHWYQPIVWNDADGNRIYVDENGIPTDNGGIPGYQFPIENYITKAQSYFSRNVLFSKRHTFNAFSTYNKKIGEHDLKLMLGTNIVAYEWESQSIRRTNLINEDNPQLNFTTGNPTVSAGTNWDSQAGFYGRLNYAFKDKYLFEGVLRRDGTSKFPKHLRWRTYPGVSAGWVVSNESFMQDISRVLSHAKLRGSWGSIGDQSVSNDLYVPTMGGAVLNNWLDGSGAQFYQIGTPGAISTEITWQDIEQWNVGADLRFFNRLGVELEWYERTTKNMLIPGESMPSTFGAAAPLGNFGTLRTRGWEIKLDYSHIFENGLRLTANANLADAISVTTKGADWRDPWENRSIGTTFSTGRRYGDIWGYVTDRLFQKEDFVYDADGNFVPVTIIHQGSAKVTNQLAGNNPVYQTWFEDGNILKMAPGDVKFVDVNGDGYITPGKGTNGDPGDRVVIGNSLPRYEYGFRLGADWKGFDLGLFFQGIGKREIWGDGQLAIPGYHVKDGAMPQAIAGDFWKEDRTDAFYPRAWNLGISAGESPEGYIMRPQTRYLLDMSYFRVKNITVGYALPDHVVRNARLKKARIYVSLENMINFDNLRGLPIDPEAINGYSSLASSNYNWSRTGAGNPAFKSASVGVQIGL